MTRSAIKSALPVGATIVGAIALAACTNSIAASTSSTAKQTEGPISCAIEQTRTNGLVRLDAVVSADQDLSGEYRFSVKGSGTNINQGGRFVAVPNKDTKVGVIQLSKGAYNVKLTVDGGGNSVSCTESVKLAI